MKNQTESRAAESRADLRAEAEATNYYNLLPETGFLRLTQIIGDKKKGIPPIVPISRSAWWLGVRNGVYPQSVKISPKVTAWRVQDIKDLIFSLNKKQG